MNKTLTRSTFRDGQKVSNKRQIRYAWRSKVRASGRITAAYVRTTNLKVVFCQKGEIFTDNKRPKSTRMHPAVSVTVIVGLLIP